MRRAVIAVAFFGLTLATIARGAEEERVTLRDGTIVQGELVEKSPGRKLVLKLAAGEIRTFQWNEIVLSKPKDAEVINLADGGTLQGKLVELVPGDHWTLKLATGEVRKIPWTDVLGDRQPPPEPVLPAIPPPEARPVQPTPKAAPLITLNKPAPVEAPAAHDVHPKGARPAGVALIIGGVLGMVGGGSLIGGAFAAPDETIVVTSKGRSTTASPEGGLLASGIIVGVLGLVALGIGIPLVVIPPKPTPR